MIIPKYSTINQREANVKFYRGIIAHIICTSTVQMQYGKYLTNFLCYVDLFHEPLESEITENYKKRVKYLTKLQEFN